MKRIATLAVAFFSLALPFAAAQNPAAANSPDRALQALGELLGRGIGSEATPDVILTFQNLRLSLDEEDDTLRAVSVAVAPVEGALAADIFELEALTSALQDLAFALRAAAGPERDEASLMVEIASLIDQTADLLEQDGLDPRMEVEVP